MSTGDDMNPLAPEIRALLAAEASRLDAPPPGVDARLRARLSASIAVPPAAGGSASEGSPRATGSAPSAAAAKAKLAMSYVAVLAAGAAIGAYVHAAVTPAETRVVYVPAPVDAAVRVAPAPTEAPSAIPVDSLPTAPAPKPRTSALVDAGAAPVAADDAFVLERRLLDHARTSVVAGDLTGALALLDEHERTYPRGRFVEEREAMRVRALADAGRRDEARTAAARFASRWPNSVLLPAVQAAVATP